MMKIIEEIWADADYMLSQRLIEERDVTVPHEGSMSVDLTHERCHGCGLAYVIDWKEGNRLCTTPSCPRAGIVLDREMVDDLRQVCFYHHEEKQAQNNTFVAAPFVYEKKFHFERLVHQFMGAERNNIDDDVLEQAKRYLVENGLEVTPMHVRFLKDKKLGRYSPHIMQMVYRLGNHESHKLTSMQLMALKNSLDALQEVFVKVIAPKYKRKNFMNVPFVMAKLCDIHGMPQIVPSTNRLKCRATIVKMERMWMDVCEYMNWPYMRN